MKKTFNILVSCFILSCNFTVSQIPSIPKNFRVVVKDTTTPNKNGIPLLILIASNAHSHLTSIGVFQRWTNQINIEGVFYSKLFVLESVLKTNTVFNTNRFQKSKEIWDIIETNNPKVVQIIGGLSIVATGSDVADGHPGCIEGGFDSSLGKYIPSSGRLTYVDWPYTGQLNWFQFTDKFNFEPNNCFLYGNKQNDGCFDQSGMIPYIRTVWYKDSSNIWQYIQTNTVPSGMGRPKRIISRLDFSGIDPYPNILNAPKVPTNFWSSGQLIWPKRNEMIDYENYFNWNLEYRQNKWNPTPDAWLYSTIWGLYPNGKTHVNNINNLSGNKLNIITNTIWETIAGKTPYMVWNGIEPNFWYYWENKTNGYPMKTVWLNTYKSYVYEYNNRLSLRTYVARGHSLIATWSIMGMVWNPIHNQPTNQIWTAYDAIKHSMGDRPFGTTDPIVGDITLPLRIPNK